jgi:hypothetical protein
VARNSGGETAISSDSKVANLLALLLVKGMHQGEAIVTLTRAGFTPTELCQLLNTTKGVVGQTNYVARRTKKKAKIK